MPVSKDAIAALDAEGSAAYLALSKRQRILVRSHWMAEARNMLMHDGQSRIFQHLDVARATAESAIAGPKFKPGQSVLQWWAITRLYYHRTYYGYSNINSTITGILLLLPLPPLPIVLPLPLPLLPRLGLLLALLPLVVILLPSFTRTGGRHGSKTQKPQN